MPGLTLFWRRWNLASDDLFYPGVAELTGRSVWFIPQLAYYIRYQPSFQCGDTLLLHIYYVGNLVIMASILLAQLAITIISTRGTITHSYPRRFMPHFIYLRIILFVVEIAWSLLGTIWLTLAKWNECSNVIFVSVLANILFCALAFIVLLVVVFFLLDPISHLGDHDQEIVKKRATILYQRVKSLLFCCYCCLYTNNSRNEHYESSYKQISSLLEMVFRGGDLTPSDVLAGIILSVDDRFFFFQLY